MSDSSDLSALEPLWQSAQARWPEVKLSLSDYAEQLRDRQARGGPATTALSEEIAADLYLAVACGRGDARALACFDHALLGQVAAFVAHVDSSRDLADEVRQRLRDKLFVAGGGARPKIDDYLGRGPLGAWVRVVAVRAALDVKRAERGPGPSEAIELLPIEPQIPDPELDLIKTRYRQELAEAFRATLESLSPQQRTVLRLHALDGCTIDEIAAVYDVHRATAARWIESARDHLLEETRRLLAERLRLPLVEIDSVLGLLRSRVELSLQTLISR